MLTSALDACDANPDFQLTLTGAKRFLVHDCERMSFATVVSCRNIENFMCQSSLDSPHHSAVSSCLMRAQTHPNCEFSSQNFDDLWLISFSSPEFLTNSNAILGGLNTSLFPGVGSEVKVHSGFRDEHAVTALDVINEVIRLMVEKNTKNITVVSFYHILNNLRNLIENFKSGRTFVGGCFGRT